MSDVDLHRLTAETRAFNLELERLLATVPSVHTVPPAQTRRDRREGTGIFPAPQFLPEARTLSIPGPAGEIPLRIIAADGPATGIYLHFHGGGWTLGANDMQDPRLKRLADATGLTVVSVDYRLSPEHPYPAGPDDCEAAAAWLLSADAEDQLRATGPRAIGGDSAGAHLAAVTLLRLRDRHAVTGAFAAAVFQYGAFDLSMSPSQRLWGGRNLVLSGPIISWFGDQFLPHHDREARRDPDISPLFADLTAMPAAMFIVGTQDALLDDTLFMHARWQAAGHPAQLTVWPEAPHGFLGFPISVTEATLAAEHEFLHERLQLSLT